MKRKTILFTVCLWILCLCAGCSQSEDKLDPNNPVELQIWHYYTGDSIVAIDNAIAEFNDTVGLEKGIIVEAFSQGNNAQLEDKIMDALAGSEGSELLPSMFCAYQDVALTLHQEGLLANIYDYVSPRDLEPYIVDFLKDGELEDGLLVSLPIVKSTEMLVVNKTDWEIFKDATGVNESYLATWEGMLACAELYYQWTEETSGEGKAFFGLDSLPTFILILNKQLGIEILEGASDGSGKVNIEEDALKRIWDFYYQGYVKGYIGSYGSFRSDDMKTGDLICYVGSSSSASYIPTQVFSDDSEYEIDIMIKPFPVFENGSSYAIQQGAGMVVKKDTRAKEEASVIFLTWFTDAHTNLDFAMRTGYLPVTTDALSGDEIREKLDILENGEKKDQIIASAYKIAMDQILVGQTFTLSAFDNSFEARRIIGDTLDESAQAGRVKYLQTGSYEELDPDKEFHLWIERMMEKFAAINLLQE